MKKRSSKNLTSNFQSSCNAHSEVHHRGVQANQQHTKGSESTSVPLAEPTHDKHLGKALIPQSANVTANVTADKKADDKAVMFSKNEALSNKSLVFVRVGKKRAALNYKSISYKITHASEMALNRKNSIYTKPKNDVTRLSLNDDILIDMKYLVHHSGLSDKHFYSLIKQGRFPKPIKLGRSSRWRQSEYEKWLADREKQR